MFNITDDRTNKDVGANLTPKQARKFYLELYSEGKKFKPKLKMPEYQSVNNRQILRCDLVGGLKAIAAEKYIASIKNDVVVYCAPRTGHASYAIAKLAKMYKKKAVFFAPASSHAAPGQYCVMSEGAQLRFVRIAAMPVLNSYAKKWAEKYGAAFLPFGLSGVPEVTAGIVNLADYLAEKYGFPREFWCATSTGTMIRGLELGWLNATPKTVAVARNIHVGEIGWADIRSSTVPFLQRSKIQPPFPTTACYDAKAWEPCLDEGKRNSVFINVGADATIEEAASKVDISKLDSWRDWGDMKDLERAL